MIKPYVLSPTDALAINAMNQMAANVKLPLYSDLLASLAMLAKDARECDMLYSKRSLKKATKLLEVMRLSTRTEAAGDRP